MDDLFKSSFEFEWDNGNKEKNWNRHKVKYSEAEQAFKNRIKVVTFGSN